MIAIVFFSGSILVLFIIGFFYSTEGGQSNFESLLKFIQNKRREQIFFELSKEELEDFKEYVAEYSHIIGNTPEIRLREKEIDSYRRKKPIKQCVLPGNIKVGG